MGGSCRCFKKFCIYLWIFTFLAVLKITATSQQNILIETVKHPADHAQKSQLLFVYQVAKRLLESELIKKAKQALQHSHEVNIVEKSVDNFSNLPNSVSFHVTFNNKNGVCVSKWLGKKYLQKNV